MSYSIEVTYQSDKELISDIDSLTEAVKQCLELMDGPLGKCAMYNIYYYHPEGTYGIKYNNEDLWKLLYLTNSNYSLKGRDLRTI